MSTKVHAGLRFLAALTLLSAMLVSATPYKAIADEAFGTEDFVPNGSDVEPPVIQHQFYNYWTYNKYDHMPSVITKDDPECTELRRFPKNEAGTEFLSWQGEVLEVCNTYKDNFYDESEFGRYCMEGSGFYFTDGGDIVTINLSKGAGENDPYCEDARFFILEDEGINARWGVDAPVFHYGLVPWRTVAETEEDGKIPFGSYLYVDVLDQKWPRQLMKTDAAISNPTNQNYWEPAFDHDGFVQVTDGSWSFYYGGAENQRGGTAAELPGLDLYANTWSLYQLYGISGATPHVSIYPQPVSPAFSFEQGGSLHGPGFHYRHARNSDEIMYTEIAKDYKQVTQFAFGDFEGEDTGIVPPTQNPALDTDDMVVLWDGAAQDTVYVLRDSDTSHVSTILKYSTIKGVDVGDLDGNGYDDVIIMVPGGIGWWDYGRIGHTEGEQNARWLRYQNGDKVSDTGTMVKGCNFDGDDDDDVAILQSDKVVALQVEEGVVVARHKLKASNVSAIACGDVDGEDGDEELIANDTLVNDPQGYGIKAYNPDEGWSLLVHEDELVNGHDDLQVVLLNSQRIDPDLKEDLVYTVDGVAGVYAALTSDVGNPRQFDEVTPKWIASIRKVFPMGITPPPNLITNGDFESGTTDPWWYAEEDGVNYTTLSVDNNALRVDVASGSTNDWGAGVGQSALSLQAGKTYRLSFDVVSAANSFVVRIQQGKDPYDAYLQDQTITSTGSYAYEFTMPSDDPAADIFFKMGGKGAMLVKLDNIVLKSK